MPDAYSLNLKRYLKKKKKTISIKLFRNLFISFCQHYPDVEV